MSIDFTNAYNQLEKDFEREENREVRKVRLYTIDNDDRGNIEIIFRLEEVDYKLKLTERDFDVIKMLIKLFKLENGEGKREI